jgi:hypothetical protein
VIPFRAARREPPDRALAERGVARDHRGNRVERLKVDKPSSRQAATS